MSRKIANATGLYMDGIRDGRPREAVARQVDLFRLEDGLVVEHWDNVEPVPPRDEWANSGKF